MRLLALDQASKTSGYSIWDDDKLIDYGKFTFDDKDLGERLYKIRNKVRQLIEDNIIDTIAFEDIQLQNNVVNNVKTFKVLAEVFGVIYELITEMNLKSYVVLAGTWKSTLDIKGKTRPIQKRNAQLYVLNTYDIEAPQDTCDAICIGAHIVKSELQEEGFDWSN